MRTHSQNVRLGFLLVPQKNSPSRSHQKNLDRVRLVPANKIAIAIYFYRLGIPGGGAERMVCALANALAVRELDVHIVTWDAPDASSYYPLDNRVTWHRLGFRPGPFDKVRRTFALARVLRREGVRVLVGFVMSGDKTVYGAAKLAGVRLVAAERNAPAMYYLCYSKLQRWQFFSLLHPKSQGNR